MKTRYQELFVAYCCVYKEEMEEWVTKRMKTSKHRPDLMRLFGLTLKSIERHYNPKFAVQIKKRLPFAVGKESVLAQYGIETDPKWQKAIKKVKVHTNTPSCTTSSKRKKQGQYLQLTSSSSDGDEKMDYANSNNNNRKRPFKRTKSEEKRGGPANNPSKKRKYQQLLYTYIQL